MSASDKKKLRKEQVNAALTEKQRQAQKEAKQLKIYTITFVCIMLVFAIAAASIFVMQRVNLSGILLKNTVAASVGEEELNTVELNYYYNDAINEFYNQWYQQYETYTDTYLEAVGLNVKEPLDEQFYDEEAKQTWADYFIETAIENAKKDLTFYNLAKSENFELPEDEQAELDSTMEYMGTYATLYGYSDADAYLRRMYGNGADMKSYRQYAERRTIANSFIHEHEHSLTYTSDDLSKYEEDKVSQYNSYTYHSAYLSYTDFRQGGTEGEDGNKTYTDEENNAAREAMKAAAEKLGACKTLDELKEMLPTIQVNEDSQLAINEYKNQRHTAVNAAVAEWLSGERKEGDITAIASETTSTDADGNETTTVNGYYVVCFVSVNTNEEPMSNVRHLLVAFEGGKQDETTGQTTYSDEEKAAAKKEADELLKTWKEGDATEDSFIELVKEKTDDTGSAETGGLYENINPDSQYVPNFLSWAISPDRQKGDVEIVETEYGYHIMYYVGDSEMTYRDYMLTEDKRAEDQQAWYDEILKPVTTAKLDTSKMTLNKVISNG